MWFAPYTCDLKPFLPEDWVQQVNDVAATAPRVVSKPGPGSMTTANEGGGLDYLHHTADYLTEQLPWMGSLYETAIPILLEAALQEAYLPIGGAEGLSLNVLTNDSTRKGLEWHVDGPDVACNLVLSNGNWNAATGGRFLAHDGRTLTEYEITAGVGLVVPTGKLPHSVEPLQVDGPRVTMMFAYTTEQLRAAHASDREAQNRYNAGALQDVTL
jgi:hypothetical protein